MPLTDQLPLLYDTTFQLFPFETIGTKQRGVSCHTVIRKRALWIGILLLMLLFSVTPLLAESGFSEKYERDSNIFNPANRYVPDYPLNPAQAYAPDNPFNPANRFDPIRRIAIGQSKIGRLANVRVA